MSLVKKWGDNTTDDYNGRTIDSYMNKAFPWNNYDGPQLEVGCTFGPPDILRPLLSFDIKADLEALQAVSIISANLNLWVQWKQGAFNVGAYRCLQDWVEAQVSWNEFKVINMWNMSGCSAADDSGVDDDPLWDRHATALDSQPPGAILSYSLVLDITALAQAWFAGTVKEYGVTLISDNEAPGNSANLYPRETLDGKRPYLELEINMDVFKLSGTVKQYGTAVQRIVRCYNRSTGILYDSTTSNPDGTFELNTPDDTTEMYVLALDDIAGEQFNALIYDRIKGVIQ